MVNSTSLSMQVHTRRPESKGSNHCYHSKSRQTISQLTLLLPFTGPASWNSTTKLLRLNGRRRMNAIYLSGETVSTLPVMYTGPPLAAPTYPLPAIPELTILTQSIIQSSDQFFFISQSVSSNEARKWGIVQVAFEESMSSYPSCLQDGCFLLNFFICHPSDLHVNAINQRYSLQYHTLSELQSPLTMTNTHLIRPSDTLVDYGQCHNLRPFRNGSILPILILSSMAHLNLHLSMAGKHRIVSLKPTGMF
jgi:hypothetical protein